jgi:DNA-binding MarR family transcriptional regulator
MKQIENFLEFSESLKLVRKAEPEFEGISIIDDIYTDLLPNNGILNRVNLPRTTILIGRKGTGKSTIFLKSQNDLDKNKDNLVIYIDAKSLYDNSTPTLPKEIENYSSSEITKYLIYSNLIREIILRTKEKIKKRLSQDFIKKILGVNDAILLDVSSQLNEIELSIDNVFKSLNTSLITVYKNIVEKAANTGSAAGINISAKNAGFNLELTESQKEKIKKEFESALVSYLDIKKCLIENLLKIRNILSVKNLYIYLDDFSEINKEPQKLFMDWFIAPLNNLSEDFVKFKIAVYPKRLYYGLLDNSKIDEISLDFFDAFYTYERKNIKSDISKMEHLSLDYTKRLLENRVKIFFKNINWLDYFNMPESELYQILFKTTLNLPRKLGYLLSFCYESCLIHNEKITKNAIENASLRYYNDVIEKYFLVNEYICKPFDDKISDQHHYDLLKEIIEKQAANNEVIKRRKNNFTSHFLVNNDLSYLLSNLEINGFITTYNKIKDINNVFSVIFCLDYGLCKKYNLRFGSPATKDFDRNFSYQIYNFNNTIVEFFNSTQVIKCEEGHEFPYSDIKQFKMFNMTCPICIELKKISKCNVTIKYTELKERFIEREKNKSINITFPEFLILDFLKDINKSVSIKPISEITDYSYTTVRLQIEKLVSKGLIDYDKAATKKLKKEIVFITEKGIRTTKGIHEILNKVKETK